MAPRNTAPEPLLTTKELAALLHVEPQTIHLWRTKGLGPPAIKLSENSKLLFRWADVTRWLDERAERARAG